MERIPWAPFSSIAKARLSIHADKAPFTFPRLDGGAPSASSPQRARPREVSRRPIRRCEPAASRTLRPCVDTEGERPDPEYLLPSERAPAPAEGAPPAAEP